MSTRINDRYELNGLPSPDTLTIVITDLVLERRSQMRLLNIGALNSADDQFFFRYQSRPLTRLHDASVQSIYSAGIDKSGRPFLVRELLDDERLLAHLLEQQALNAEQR